MGGRLSPTMLGVLQSVADPHPDDSPFPPMNTLAALARRKLIRFVEIKKPRGAFEMLAGRQVQRIQITKAGREALREASPTPSVSLHPGDLGLGGGA